MLLSFNQYSSRAMHSIGLYIFFFFFLAIPCSLRDLSSLTRTELRATAVKVPNPGPREWKCRTLITGPLGNSHWLVYLLIHFNLKNNTQKNNHSWTHMPFISSMVLTCRRAPRMSYLLNLFECFYINYSLIIWITVTRKLDLRDRIDSG